MQVAPGAQVVQVAKRCKWFLSKLGVYFDPPGKARLARLTRTFLVGYRSSFPLSLYYYYYCCYYYYYCYCYCSCYCCCYCICCCAGFSAAHGNQAGLWEVYVGNAKSVWAHRSLSESVLDVAGDERGQSLQSAAQAWRHVQRGAKVGVALAVASNSCYF